MRGYFSLPRSHRNRSIELKKKRNKLIKRSIYDDQVGFIYNITFYCVVSLVAARSRLDDNLKY